MKKIPEVTTLITKYRAVGGGGGQFGGILGFEKQVVKALDNQVEGEDLLYLLLTT